MTMSSTRRDFLGTHGRRRRRRAGAVRPLPEPAGRGPGRQGFPTRLLIVFSGNGSVPGGLLADGRARPTSPSSRGISEPLAPFKSKLIFPHEPEPGAQRPRRARVGHGLPVDGVQPQPGLALRRLLQGRVDRSDHRQEAARRPTAFPSLEFGVQHDGPGANSRLLTVMCYTGSDQPLPPESSPYKMLDRLMLGSASAPTGIRPEDLLKIRMRKQSALDLVKQRADRAEHADRPHRPGQAGAAPGGPDGHREAPEPPDRRPHGPGGHGLRRAQQREDGHRPQGQRQLPRAAGDPEQPGGGGAGLQPHPRGQPAVVPRRSAWSSTPGSA